LFRSYGGNSIQLDLTVLAIFHPRVISAALVAVICGQFEAAAQTAAPGATRPYRAVFGGSAANPDVHHSLSVSATVLAGYDENAPVSFGEIASPLLQTGTFLGIGSGLAYSFEGKRVQFGANAGTNMRYYRDDGEWIGTNHYGSFGVSAQLTQRLNVVLNQSVSYAPSYSYSLMPGFGSLIPGTAVGGGDFPLGDQSITVYDTAATASLRVTRRGSIAAVSTYRYSDFGGSGKGTVTGLRSYSVGGRYRYGITRNASLRLGYVYREGQYGYVLAAPATAVHDIDLGVDYRRALSFTRRTSLEFSTGSSLVTVPVAGTESNQLQYRIGGDVGLSHEIGRTWRARLAYSRGIGFAEAFAEPIFSNAVNLSITGFFTRRIDFNAYGGLAIGDVGLAAPRSASPLPGVSTSQFHAWNASVRVRYAIAPMWAVHGEYLYYSQDFGTANIVPAGVPPVLDRQTLQVGLTLWVPLLRR
jgi:hypothetical protein